MARAQRRRAAGQDRRVPPAPRARRDPRRPADRGVRGHARGRPAGDRPAPLRRAADGWRRAALRLGRRDEDRRGQDPRVARCPPTSTGSVARACTSSRSTTTWPASTPSGWVASTSWMGLEVGLIIPGFKEQSAREAARTTPATSPTARTTSSASTTCATTWPPTLDDKVQRGHSYAIVDEVDSILIDEARTPLIICGRVADAAKLYYRFARIVRSLQARRRLRGRRGQAHRRADRGRHREGRAGARHREPVRRGAAEPRPPAAGRAEGQGAVQARQGLHHPGRRGEDRRRVHRSHPRGSALERGHPPGGRGQGGREDQGGEPDPRHDHAPELLPHVRQARRHDRYRARPRRPS